MKIAPSRLGIVAIATAVLARVKFYVRIALFQTGDRLGPLPRSRTRRSLPVEAIAENLTFHDIEPISIAPRLLNSTRRSTLDPPL
ncbi:hypothetical protein HCG48_21885 [Oxynema aestuarii AP17]|uniref:Uncharacterized protein n=1 Tax=Oxynema aestuarii AP17 TaxID=2064643 RepID=A0A6H1U264_9CYAN|nr:hypothetical protein HCG48_21885 [Oxynema aestuarii AP17]